MKPMTLIGSIFILLAVLLVGVNLAYQNTPPSISSHATESTPESAKLARERLAEAISSGRSAPPPIVGAPAASATTVATPMISPTSAVLRTAAPSASPSIAATAVPTQPANAAPISVPINQSTPQSATPRPVTPAPATPHPATPHPATPHPAAPRPATPRPATPHPPAPHPPTSRPAMPAPRHAATIIRTTPPPATRRTAPTRPAPPVRTSAPHLQSSDIARLRALKRQADFDAVRRATLARAAAYPPGSHVRTADVREVAPGQYRVFVVKETPAGIIVEQFGLRATRDGFVETRHRIIPSAKTVPQAPATKALMPLSTAP